MCVRLSPAPICILCLVVFILTGDAQITDNRYNYTGCFVDQDDPRELSGYVEALGENNSPEKCVALCKEKGYVYAGLEYRYDCFCGDKNPEPTKRADERDCNHKCPGNIRFNCGGDERINVYATGNPEALIIDRRYRYVGCFVDQEDPRELSGYVVELGNNNSPERCIDLCKQRGYVYAGLQYKTDCFCGDKDPEPAKQAVELQCSHKCPGDIRYNCGGDERINVYKTGNLDNNAEEGGCIKSVTRVNGKAACQNEVVFEDNFDRLSPENWSHIIQIAMKPDYQFVIYNSDNANAYISNGKLAIKPTLLPDTDVRGGDLHLQNCTGKTDAGECGYKAISYKILPPVLSARLTTRKSFNFLYGKVEISAKLPAGDWLVPEIWLEPTSEVYGPGYTSGRVRIAMTRGNSDLKLNGNDIGYKQLETGVLLGLENDVRQHTMITQTVNGWPNEYHKYSVIWTPESLMFMVDDEQVHSVMPNTGQSLSASVGFTPDVTSVWSASSKLAPFDKDFYISLGVSAGGFRDFADNVVNKGIPKPWKNLELKAMLNFWRHKGSWQSTWHDDTALLQVDYIKVTAL